MMIKAFRSLLILLSLCLLTTLTAYAQTPPELNITLGEQHVRFAPTRGFLEMRLEVVNSVGEVVFTHTTAEAEFDWNLRASSGESLEPGLYRYALTLKFSEETTHQHRGHFIVEKGQEQIWLTAQDGAEISGAALSATRNGERSLAGMRMTDRNPAKRQVEGRQLATEKDKQSGDADKAEKNNLLATGNQLAKFAADGVTLIDSTITETGGNVGIGVTTPGSILEMFRPGPSEVVFRMGNSTRLWSVGVNGSGDFWRIRDNTAGAARLVVAGGTGNIGIGTLTPAVSLDVVGGSGGALYTTTYGTDNAVIGRAANGTASAPTATPTGRSLLFLGGRGHTGAGFTFSKAGVNLTASENWTSTNNGARITFDTTANGDTNRVERMRVDHNGRVGIATLSPVSLLDVDGTATLRGSAGGLGLTVTSGGNVGIHTTTPAGQLEVVDNSGNGALFTTTFGNDNAVIGRATGGTAGAPTATPADRSLMFLGGRGHTGAGFTFSRAAVNLEASENWTSTANGTRITFDTTANGTTTRVQRMVIDHDGKVGINDEPQAWLDIDVEDRPGTDIGISVTNLVPGGRGLSAVTLPGDLAGAFTGDVIVNGDVDIVGNLTKGSGAFKIDHPLDPTNKYLYHSFVESPDMKNIYDGNVTTDAGGVAEVVLPDWFEALNKDFRYQLTVLGQFAQAIVAEKIKDNRFKIRTSLPNVEVSWQVTGIRQDAFAEKHRIPVEGLKPEKERGSYLHPAVFDQPEEKGVGWALRPEMMKEMKERREKAKQPAPPPASQPEREKQ